MPEYIRRGTFMSIIDDDDEEFGLEVGLNYLFFYNVANLLDMKIVGDSTQSESSRV